METKQKIADEIKALEEKLRQARVMEGLEGKAKLIEPFKENLLGKSFSVNTHHSKNDVCMQFVRFRNKIRWEPASDDGRREASIEIRLDIVDVKVHGGDRQYADTGVIRTSRCERYERIENATQNLGVSIPKEIFLALWSIPQTSAIAFMEMVKRITENGVPTTDEMILSALRMAKNPDPTFASEIDYPHIILTPMEYEILSVEGDNPFVMEGGLAYLVTPKSKKIAGELINRSAYGFGLGSSLCFSSSFLVTENRLQAIKSLKEKLQL